jgi:hypothetical protein
MKSRRTLPLAAAETALGLPTIMDRDLAAAHGVEYVHLAVFAIDIDRVYWLEPELASLPFGWEVFLTEWYLLSRASAHELTDMLEAVCGALLEETPGEPPLGGQLVFAVFDAVQRGALPKTLEPVFHAWRRPPHDLLESLTELHAQGANNARKLAEHCLNAELEPPLAPPTRAALREFAGLTAADRGT